MIRPFLAPALALAAVTLASCTEEGDPTYLFQPKNARQSVPANGKVLIQERRIAYLADELTTGAGGTDYNADGDTADQIACLVDIVADKRVRLDVAALDFAFVGQHLFIVAEEAQDGQDWNADTDTTDLVLLRTPVGSPAPSTVVFVATLRRTASGPRILATDNQRLFFCQDTSAVPLGGAETAIAMIALSGGTPLAPVRLLSDDGFPLTPSLKAEENGVILVLADETDELRDLNGDADQNDEFVLGLINSAVATPKLKLTGRPMASATSAFRAGRVANNETVVAFLVDEAAHGQGSLNSYTGSFANWRPAHCTSNDVDTTDEVMHFLWLNSWFAGTTNPVNTGLAGERRVLVVRNGTAAYVASLVPEADDQNCLGTGLNNDTDLTDHVLRWVKAETPLGSSGVFTGGAGLVAVADVPGGTRGATDLSGRFVVVIDEDGDDRSWDGETPNATNNVDAIVAWLDPSNGNSAAWITDMSPNNGWQSGGASWMGELEERTRTPIGFMESVYGLPINGRDADKLDSVPVFARFDPNDANDFDFPGPAVAVKADNVGVVIANDIAYYRVDEAADNFDWNTDGDKLDLVLFRTTVSTLGDAFFVSTVANVNGPAVVTDSTNVGAAFVAEESSARVDYNGDGDRNDFVLRWMRVGP